MTPKKILDKLFSSSASGLYFVLFAAAIGVATFIENDFGTTAAQKVIFRSRWFELLLILFGITVVVNIFRFRMIQQKKWPILTFHAATIIILLGAAATRYFGSEGIMHIREGEQTNLILSSETYLQFEIKQGSEVYRFDEEVYFASLGRNRFNGSYQIGNQVIDIEMTDFIPNPVEELKADQNGQAIIKVVMGGQSGREEYLIKQGDKINLNGILFNFNPIENEGAVNIVYRQDSLLFKTSESLTQMTMATQKKDTLAPGSYYPLRLRSLYTAAKGNFVISEFNPNAGTTVTSSSKKMGKGSVGMVKLNISAGDKTGSIALKGDRGMTGKPETVVLGNTIVTGSYGAKYNTLPFGIHLKDFILERYPGTQSASSYASEVTLIDERKNYTKDQRIFMNNILDYDGYRFFQSSFDQDELGTVLSVNHDALGTWISYLGYFLLTLGMVLTLFSKKSRFRNIAKKLKDMRLSQSIASIVLPLIMTFSLVTASAAADIFIDPATIIDKEHAAQFGRLVVQDHQGRMKPVNTMASEVLRKLARKEALYDQTSDQILLGMMLYPKVWAALPLIKIGSDEEIRKIIDIDTKLAAYNDFFKPDYLLKDHVRDAYNMEPRYRGTFEKEIMKIDERVNIANMVFAGRLVKIYPSEDKTSTAWLSPGDLGHTHSNSNISPFINQFFLNYSNTVHEASKSDNWQAANQLVDELCQYQQAKGGDILPSNSKIKYEILLNKMNVFSRVGKWYGLLGLLILVTFFILVFNPKINPKWPVNIAFGLLGVCFLAHTTGLGLRWYVSGRAPWSNGYESMIYIAFTTMLAGLIFSRKSLGGLAATSVLASTILMVAGLSWLDPEITPLVPVLKSYWLTIHVSMEAGSYGFLMLGAIIGVLNLILMIFTNSNNQKRTKRTVKEMTLVSEMTMIGGLFMISIGTYLGGVWANESWGRYWGWDAKETWALVTILVYAFILHMRFIPGLRSAFAFNVASLFGLASVLMTYFGVNYYLSGLHSYAAGDPAPIPPFVYYAVGTLFSISALAYWRNKRNGIFG